MKTQVAQLESLMETASLFAEDLNHEQAWDPEWKEDGVCLARPGQGSQSSVAVFSSVASFQVVI